MKKIVIFSLAIVSVLATAVKISAEEPAMLRDGFAIAGVDGKVTYDKNADKWFVSFSTDVSDDKGRVGAGSKLEILPSVALEKIQANIEKRPGDDYRLWARVARYEGKNYVYGIYFLPITEVAPITGAQSAKVSINEPNDPLALPDEVVAKLKTKKIIHPEELEQGVELKDDSILADRIGFIKQAKAGGAMFVIDGVGRSRGRVSLELLPCEVLEQALAKQAKASDTPRVKVAGIVTRYEGQYYLLLQRAAPVYSHGNFE